MPRMPAVDPVESQAKRVGQDWASSQGVRRPGLSTKLPTQGCGLAVNPHMWLRLECGLHMLWEPRVLSLPGPRLEPR